MQELFNNASLTITNYSANFCKYVKHTFTSPNVGISRPLRVYDFLCIAEEK